MSWVAGSWHAQAFKGSLQRLRRAPLSSLLTLVVIALALALPAGLSLLVTNVSRATDGFANALDLSVYLKADVPLERAQALRAEALQRADVAEVTVIAADQGLEEFKQYSGFGTALTALKENPLPNVLHIRPRVETDATGRLEVLRKYLATWPEADLVQVDTDWVLRFNAILRVIRRLLLLTAALLAVGVLAIVGNTIRLEVERRRVEIEIIKLVGATNAFVRRPFLYTGMMYGLGGALAAWGIVAGGVALLSGPVGSLASLYGSPFMVRGLSRQEIALLLSVGLALGWLGAWLSATRHLRALEP
jgi:cell division transport system permease protein